MKLGNRTLRLRVPEMVGPDVEALQVLLGARGFPVKVDGDYGPNTAAAVLKAKKTIPGYPRLLINKAAGKTFVKRLTAYYKPKPPYRPPKAARVRFVDLLHWGIAHEPDIHYFTGEASRPGPMRLPIHYLPLHLDCTMIGIVFAKWSGAPDPSGYHFSGAGRTSDFLAHCKRITKSELKPGDCVQFDDEHECYVLEPGSDPLLFSHGMERGPLAIRLSAETEYHRGVPIYFLRFIED